VTVAPARAAESLIRVTDLTGTLVLKHDALFLLSDAWGDVRPDNRGLGLYQGDTRILSRYELRIDEQRPVVLRTGGAASWGGTIQMTNPDLSRNPEDKTDPEAVLRRQSLGIVRERLLSDGFDERIELRNYTLHPQRCRLTLRLDADFADIFEVRGAHRERPGEHLPTESDLDGVTFTYRGADARTRIVRVALGERADSVTGRDDGVVLAIDQELSPGDRWVLPVRVSAQVLDAAAPRPRRLPSDRPRPVATEAAEAAHRAWLATSASITTTNAAVARAVKRALTDLRLLVCSGPAPGERYIAAGVPWYSTLFGRDSIITALQLLSIRPQVARDTLTLLARLQSREVDDWRDAQPGKILHELRTGELAAAGEIPHTPYYGSVDATPLWLILLGAYERWTADAELVDRLWPAALACLEWLQRHGDLDGDGFLEYQRRSPRGLINQGWKDSAEAIRWRDGRLAEGPVALVEVQAYAYRARMELARLARGRGEEGLADRLEADARALRDRIDQAYWLEDAGTYAMALDGQKRAVDGIGSNAGHVLWCGLASPERARHVADSLLGPDLFSGWGIRTLSTRMAGYNPIGYHLGTVWPHDNAICAAGLWSHGFSTEATAVAAALLDATQYFRDSRLPELFCGFDRASSQYPVPYPVACSPQAWASGAVFQLIHAMLGLDPDAAAHELRLVSPSLPDWLPDVRLENLRVGDAVVDLLVRRSDGSTGVEVLRRSGQLDVVVRV
jgi:glycogen debranching enzyme